MISITEKAKEMLLQFQQKADDDIIRVLRVEIIGRGEKGFRYDLNLVDRSDFIIAHILPDVASWGSAEELVTAVRMKKPIFISMEGGKSQTPLWILGMLPHNYIYNSK